MDRRGTLSDSDDVDTPAKRHRTIIGDFVAGSAVREAPVLRWVECAKHREEGFPDLSALSISVCELHHGRCHQRQNKKLFVKHVGEFPEVCQLCRQSADAAGGGWRRASIQCAFVLWPARSSSS